MTCLEPSTRFYLSQSQVFVLGRRIFNGLQDLEALTVPARPSALHAGVEALLPGVGPSNTVTRRGGAIVGRAAGPTPIRIAVDVREFMSSLPAVLHSQGLRLTPLTVEVCSPIFSRNQALPEPHWLVFSWHVKVQSIRGLTLTSHRPISGQHSMRYFALCGKPCLTSVPCPLPMP